MEKWKPYPLNDQYLISDLGRVKSLKKIICQSNGHKMTFPEKILRPALSGNGYQYVTLTKNGKHKAHKVHRLVAETFLGNFDSNRPIVHHIDHNRTNNQLSNLAWVTQKENMHESMKFHNTIPLRDDHGRFSMVIV